MKICYKNKRLKFYLIMTVFWLIFGIVNLLLNEFGKRTTYIWLGISITYISIYSYHYFNQYLTIQKGMIKENYLFGKKIKLAEIIQIKKFAGDYILKTEKTELTINTQIIDKKSFMELNTELEKLRLEWN